jgi:hypothetical protein
MKQQVTGPQQRGSACIETQFGHICFPKCFCHIEPNACKYMLSLSSELGKEETDIM